MDKNKQLAEMPVRKLFFQMAIPTLLAQLVNLLYNVVDRMYVGRIPGTGSLSLAGLGVAFPIVLLVSAFAAFVGMGGAPRASIAMGNKDTNTAEKLLGNSISLLAVFSVVLSIFFLNMKEPILMMFGASSSSLPYADSYLSIYLLGTFFVMIAVGLTPFITTQGYAKISMITVVIGCVMNIILDTIFIFGLHMGVAGAALATVIAQAISAMFVMSFFISKKSFLRIRLKNLMPSRTIILSILSLGASAFLMQSTECIIQLVFNTGMQIYGDDNYVALMSIFFSVMQIIFLPVMGFGQGAQPIIGYNYGSGNLKRVKETYRLLITLSVAFSFVLVSLTLLFPQAIIGVFSDDLTLIALGTKPLRVFLFGMLFFGFQSAAQQTFLALGQAKASIFIAVLRKLILLTPLAIILPKLGGLGVWGLFIAEPISDTLSVLAAFIMFQYKKKQLGFQDI